MKFETMGQALGIPDSGLLTQREPSQAIDPNEPLDKLLLNKRFRQSFMAFADRSVFCSRILISNSSSLPNAGSCTASISAGLTCQSI